MHPCWRLQWPPCCSCSAGCWQWCLNAWLLLSVPSCLLWRGSHKGSSCRDERNPSTEILPRSGLSWLLSFPLSALSTPYLLCISTPQYHKTWLSCSWNTRQTCRGQNKLTDKMASPHAIYHCTGTTVCTLLTSGPGPPASRGCPSTGSSAESACPDEDLCSITKEKRVISTSHSLLILCSCKWHLFWSWSRLLERPLPCLSLARSS